MKHGSEWYKREPTAYLGGVQGLTAKEHAVFSVVLDLIYQHGGSVNNDPAWVAGWISDMGAAAVRKAINSLIERGKLTCAGDQLTNARANSEAKTKENLRETRAKSGKKGGIESGKSRAANNENNSLSEANAYHREEKTRVDIGGGDAPEPEILTYRERVLIAAGHPPDGMTANGKLIASQGDFAEFSKNVTDLGLSEAEAIAVVAETSQRKRDGPAASLSYFLEPLRRAAGKKNAPTVTPIIPTAQTPGGRKHDQPATKSQRRISSFTSGARGTG